ncbi:hypothetical protein D9M72_163270 [compost metagenome]
MNTTSLSFSVDIVLALNVLWFSAGAIYFGVTATSATKLLVSRPARQSPLFSTVSAAVRFLGGMNLAFAVLSGILLFNRALFPEATQVAVLMSVLALAHGTQFAANVPVALSRNGQGEPHWPVLSGLMLRIFLMDFALMVANGTLAAFLFAT